MVGKFEGGGISHREGIEFNNNQPPPAESSPLLQHGQGMPSRIGFITLREPLLEDD